MIIFYGADHLEGMENDLMARGYQPAGAVEWENAVTVHPFAEGLDQRDIDRIDQELKKIHSDSIRR